MGDVFGAWKNPLFYDSSGKQAPVWDDLQGSPGAFT